MHSMNELICVRLVKEALEKVDNKEADKEEKVDIMGRRRRMRRCLQDH